MAKNSENNANANEDAIESMVEQLDTQGGESPEQIVDILEQQVVQLRDRELKAQAELENFRKRLQRDTEQQLKYATTPLVHDLLDVVDNLQRAVGAADQSADASGVTEGVRIVLQQLGTVLEKHHCKPIPAVGHPFDPNVHQAIAQQPSAEYPAGTVMLETSVGYTLHDRVVRPSMVIVSTGAGS